MSACSYQMKTIHTQAVNNHIMLTENTDQHEGINLTLITDIANCTFFHPASVTSHTLSLTHTPSHAVNQPNLENKYYSMSIVRKLYNVIKPTPKETPTIQSQSAGEIICPMQIGICHTHWSRCLALSPCANEHSTAVVIGRRTRVGELCIF